jgi:hypothetical protein
MRFLFDAIFTKPTIIEIDKEAKQSHKSTEIMAINKFFYFID